MKYNTKNLQSKSIILLIVALFCVTTAFAQDITIQKPKMETHTPSSRSSSSTTNKNKINSQQVNNTEGEVVNDKSMPSVVEKNDEEAWAFYRKTYQAIEAEQYDKAIEYANKGIQYSSDRGLIGALYCEIATAYYYLGNKSEAINACHNGLAEDDTNAQLQYNLGVYLYETEQFEQAERAFERLFKLCENIHIGSTEVEYIWGGYQYLGLMKLKQKQYLTAESYFLKAIEKAPNKQSDYLQGTYGGLGDAYFYQKKYKEAIPIYEKAIALGPRKLTNMERYYRIGCCYLENDNVDKTIENYKTFLKVFSENIENIQMLSQLDKDGLERANALFGISISATLWLGRLCYYTKDFITTKNQSDRMILTFDYGKGIFTLTDYPWLIDIYSNINDDISTANLIIEKGIEQYPDNTDMLEGLLSMSPNDLSELARTLLQKIIEK